MALRRFALDTASLTIGRALQTLAATLSLPLIARMVGPVDYGLMALAMTFVVFSIFVADCGMGQSLVRTPSGDNETWSSVFWTMIAFGGGLSILLVALAWPLAFIFKQPRLLHLLLALSAIPLLVASIAPALADLQQRRCFRELALIEVVSAMLGLGVAIAFAVKGAGAWAMVLQQLTIWCTKIVLFIKLTRFRPRLYWRRSRLSGHLGFARDNIGAALLYFVTRQIDPIVIVKVLGAAALGNYSFAVRIMMLPQQLIGSPSQNTLYVRMAELRHRSDVLKSLFLIVTSGIALIVLPAVAILGAASSAYFTCILSAEWAKASTIFVCLAPVAALQTLMVPASALLPAVGRTTIKLRLQFELALLWVLGLLISVKFGIVAVALAFTIVNVAYFPRYMQLTLKVVGCSSGEYWRALRGPVAAAAVGLCLHVAVSRALQPSAATEIVQSIAELALIYLMAGWLDRRHILGQAKSLKTIMRMPAFNHEAASPAL